MYPIDGQYQVTLTTTTNHNCVNSITQTVTSFPVPVADFTYQSQCLYDEVPFNSGVSSINNPGTIANYNWNFGDGQTSNLANPNNLYAVHGIYDVTLTLTSGNNCVNAITYPISLYPVPQAAFTFSNECLYDALPFSSATSTVSAPDNITTFEWNFGNGQTSLQVNPSHLYTADGNYTVQLITTTNNNCKDTVTHVVTAYPIPQPNYTYVPTCLYSPTPFTSTSTINAPDNIVNYVWNYGDGSALDQGALPTPNHSFPAAGMYTVQLITTSNHNCVNSITLPVEVYYVPIANFSASTVCENVPPTVFTNNSIIGGGTIAVYSWDFNDGTMSNLQSPTHIYEGAGTYDVNLHVTSNNGCVHDVTVPVIVHPKPTAAFTSNITESCSPACIELQNLSESNATAILNYQWSFGNGTTSNEANHNRCFINPSNTDDITVNAQLIVTNNFGCKDTMFVADYISVYHNPVAAFYPTPPLTHMYDTEIGFVNQSIGADAYFWSMGDGTSLIDFEPTHNYLDTGTYVVVLDVTTIHGCTDQTQTEVVIEPIISIYVPNAFTPDGNGKNDDFFFKGYGIVAENFEFAIFNRWGDLIYFTQNFTPWNGTHNGEPSQQDVYAYKLKCQDVFGNMHVKVGHVTLIR